MLAPRPQMTSLPCLITKRAAIESREWIPAVSMASTSPKSMMIFESPLLMRSWMGFSNSPMSGASIRPLGNKTRMAPSRLCMASIVKSCSETSERQFLNETGIGMNAALLPSPTLYAKLNNSRKINARQGTERLGPAGLSPDVSVRLEIVQRLSGDLLCDAPDYTTDEPTEAPTH